MGDVLNHLIELGLSDEKWTYQGVWFGHVALSAYGEVLSGDKFLALEGLLLLSAGPILAGLF